MEFFSDDPWFYIIFGLYVALFILGMLIASFEKDVSMLRIAVRIFSVLALARGVLDSIATIHFTRKCIN